MKKQIKSLFVALLAVAAFSSCAQSLASMAEYDAVVVETEAADIIAEKWGADFRYAQYPKQSFEVCVEVAPGESIQAAIDEVSSKGGGVVKLAEGVHVVNEMIAIKSGVTIMGAGIDKTTVKEGQIEGNACFIIDTKPQIVDVVLRDFALVGENIGNVQGIFITGVNEARHNRIMFQDLVVTGWGSHGVHIKRTDNIVMNRCKFTENGIRNGLYHNLYFLFNKEIMQSDCDFSNPVMGKGCKYTSCEFVLAQRCVIDNCKANGVQADNEETGYFMFHKYRISNCGQVALWFPCEYYFGKFDYTEDPKYAPQNVILNRCEIVDNTWGAMWRVVGGSYVINSRFDNRKIDMGLLKCEVEMCGESTFAKGNELYDDVKQWPADVELLW
ncbi:MAG: right-handed parallel beta-helix repeat-containing protein [Rikenellaceae bacterium]